MSNVTPQSAQAEYYSRPADERFGTLAAYLTAAQEDRDMCAEKRYNLRDVEAQVHADTRGSRVVLASPTGPAELTHYSFGQLCRTVEAPAAYLRKLPAELIARNLNHGLHDAAPVGTRANILIRDDLSKPLPVVRACTTETYGRVWDAQLAGELDRHFGDGATTAGGQWQTPPAWPGSLPSGNYRGDRDSFIVRVDGGSIVSDPSARQGDGQQMFRGLIVRNSEVGECSVTIDEICFRYICGNHMFWGAVMGHSYRRRHVGDHAVRDVVRELVSLAWKMNNRTASQDERIIRALIDHEIAHTKEAVIDELQTMGATKQQAVDAYAACEQREQASPRSFWGLAQGLTWTSQADGYQDERLELDRLAGKVLAKGAKQYAMA